MIRILLCSMVLVACGGAGRGVSAVPLTRDDAVLAAVLRHEIGGAHVADDERPCIALRGADDEAAVLAEIQARYPRALANRECSGGGPDGPVVVTATGGKAVRFDVGPVRWEGDERARVGGGGGHRGGGTRELEYTVEPRSGGWRVTGARDVLVM